MLGRRRGRDRRRRRRRGRDGWWSIDDPRPLPSGQRDRGRLIEERRRGIRRCGEGARLCGTARWLPRGALGLHAAAPTAHVPVQVARAVSEDRARPRPSRRPRHHDRARPAPTDPPRPRPSRSGRRDCRPRWSTRCPRRFRRTACATSRPRGRRASPPADSCPYCPPHGPYENGSSGKKRSAGRPHPHGKDARRTGSGVTLVSAPRMRRRWSGRRSCRWRPSVPSSA